MGKKESSFDKTFRALKIVRSSEEGIRPKQFARLFWPDSPKWENSRACGPKGRHKGMGMYCSAGCYLGTLARRGLLVKRKKVYCLTEEGNKFIENGNKKIAEELSEKIPQVISSNDLELSDQITDALKM